LRPAESGNRGHLGRRPDRKRRLSARPKGRLSRLLSRVHRDRTRRRAARHRLSRARRGGEPFRTAPDPAPASGLRLLAFRPADLDCRVRGVFLTRAR